MLLRTAGDGFHLFDHGALAVFLAGKDRERECQRREYDQESSACHDAPSLVVRSTRVEVRDHSVECGERAAGEGRPFAPAMTHFLGSEVESFIAPFDVIALLDAASNDCADLTNACGFSFSSSRTWGFEFRYVCNAE